MAWAKEERDCEAMDMLWKVRESLRFLPTLFPWYANRWKDDSHLGDFIQDETILGPEESASYTALQEQILKLLDTLTDREKRVLILRFGLEDGRTRTLEEVGKEFNVTRERIRQIEAKALRKLRHPSRARLLKGYEIL